MRTKRAILVVTDAAARAIARGHPWIFRDAASSVPAGLKAGDRVEVRAKDGSLLAMAFVDPDSPILARVIGLDGADETAAFRAHLDRAIGLREALVASEATNAYRLVNGEGDGLPGLVVDRYAHVAVVRLDGAGPAGFFARHERALIDRLTRAGVRSIARRAARDATGDKLTPMAGEAPPETLTVSEHGMIMEVDLAHGQKTGAFLDQRENRRRVRDLTEGRRVLNLFSYAGGFSLAAALGGARHVTSVDIAQKGHATAQRSFRANGLSPTPHGWVTGDVFAFLESARAKGETWDFVVSDPPSFAPSEKAKANGLAAYRRLHRACASVLSPGGVLCASSCSSHVDMSDFTATLDVVATGRALTLAEAFGSAADHPSLPAFPEGRYLKLVVLVG